MTALLGVYTVALLTLPTNLGFETSALVLTPARLVLAIALLVLLQSFVFGGNRIHPPWATLVAWGLLLASGLATLLLNPSSEGASRLGSLIIEGFGVYWLAWTVGFNGRSREILSVAIAATAFVAGITLLLALVGLRYDEVVRAPFGSVSDMIVTVRFGLTRQAGPFDAPLFFAAWLLAASALTLPRIETNSRGRRAVWVVVWVVIGIAIVMTASRLALVGIPAAVVAYAALRRNWLGAGLSGLGVVLVGLIVLSPTTAGLLPVAESSTARSVLPTTGGSPAPSAVASASQPPIDSTEQSNQARIAASVAAIRAIQERPVFGWGPLTAKEVARAELGEANAVDNAYLVALIEHGIIGLAALLALLAVVTVATFRKSLVDAVRAGQAVALGALLAMSVVAAIFSVTQMYAAFFLLGGLSAIPFARASVIPGRDWQAKQISAERESS